MSISANVENLTNKLNEAIKYFDADDIKTAVAPIDELYNDIQWTIKEKLQEPAGRLILKLKNDEDLSEDETLLIEKWIIGDAEFYTRMENNLIDWVGECKRLFNVLSHYSSEDIDNDENKLLALGALLTDLRFTLSDVLRYSEALNRVEELKSMTRGGRPNADTKIKIAEMIEEKMRV